ncbi:sulfotransferase 2B1-like [Diretmus argenteus]
MTEEMTEELYSTYKGKYIAKLACTPESLKYFEEFTFRPDDILIVTYPKSGTVWMKQITSLIQSDGDVAVPTYERLPWLEGLTARDLNLEERPSPRLLATHFQYDMMQSSFFEVKPKIIYVVRNPRDVFTSAFHFREDLRDSLAKISEFMGKSLSSETTEKILNTCDFTNMKQNKVLNDSLAPDGILDTSKSFFRKGVCGDWKNFLTVAEAEHFDAVYKKEMEGVKYKFVWD